MYATLLPSNACYGLILPIPLHQTIAHLSISAIYLHHSLQEPLTLRLILLPIGSNFLDMEQNTKNLVLGGHHHFYKGHYSTNISDSALSNSCH